MVWTVAAEAMNIRKLTGKRWYTFLILWRFAAFPAEVCGQTLPVRTFELTEEFGVSHPLQVVTFAFDAALEPANDYYMLGPDSQEVPFQQLSGRRIAVRTDLPANERRSFKLMKGKPPASFPDSVVLTQTATYYEIRNGLTAVRVLRAEGARDRSLAPIQGFLLPNGIWTATGPNAVRQADGGNLFSPLLTARSVTSRVIETGPIQTTVEVAYAYDRPALVYGGITLLPAGPGYFRSRITLQSGQPSILVEDDTDTDLQYALNFYPEVRQDKARWRGHSASSPQFGAEPGGQALRAGHERPPVDAIRNLECDQPLVPGYITGRLSPTVSAIKWMPVWDPWSANTGWYWLLYNHTGPPEAPLVGIFSGRAGTAIGAGSSGVAPWCLPDAGGRRAGGIAMQVFRRGADATVRPRVKQFWALFVGTNGADLGDPYAVQRINRQMNIHGGINLDKVSRYQTAYPDPAGGYQGMFLPAAALDAMIARLRTDPAYASWLYNAEPTSRVLQDMWRDPGGAKANQLAEESVAYARKLLHLLVNGEGIYAPGNSYWNAGLQMMRHAIFFNELMRGGHLRPEFRRKLKAAMALFAYILHDNDFVPLTNQAGVNLGTANMPIQQMQYRHLFTLLLSPHPLLAGRVKEVVSMVEENLRGEIHESGAHRASTHYIGASAGPLLSVAQQAKIKGLGDLFQSAGRLKGFALFYLNLLTPPEPRFGGLRKLVSIGDGSTEGAELYGQLGAGFAGIDAPLSRQLMQAWAETGKVHSGFHGTTILKIDDRLPVAPLRLQSATYPGWGSVLRHAAGTVNETVAWLLHGLFYSDHRHQDHGAFSLYALGSPVVVDWGSTYSPQTAGPYLHSSVLLESRLKHNWDTAHVPLDTGDSAWNASDQAAFEGFARSTRATGRYTLHGAEWLRTVRMIAADPDYPVVAIHDRFRGAGPETGRIATLNLMAKGPVQSTAGTFEPELRTWNGVNLKQLPSALPPRHLEAGLSRFNFIGQWGVDFELYTYSPQPQQVTIGNWAHTWHPNTETSQFFQATGRAFEERQHIFRLKSSDDFEMLLVPFRKGARKPGLTVSRSASGTLLKSKIDELVVGPEYHAYQSPARTVLATSGAAEASGYGIRIRGGPAEVLTEGALARITVHGAPGLRTLHLPGAWTVESPWRRDNSVYTFDYAGGAPRSVVFRRTAASGE